MSVATNTEGTTQWPIPWTPLEGSDTGVLPWLEAVGARAALATLRNLPQPLVDGWCNGTARLLRRFDARHANAARRFLTTALGEMPETELEERVLQAYRHFLRVMVEADIVARMSLDERRERIEVVGRELVEDIAGNGQGCLVSTAHFGNWEVAASSMPLVGFGCTYAVGKMPGNHYLTRNIQKLREGFGVRLLPRRGAMEAAPVVLKAGGVMGLLLDQRARTKPVIAPFFGRPARCDRSAGVLIRRMKVPLVFVFATCLDEPLTWRFEIAEVIQPEELSGLRPEQIATRVNQAYERAILRTPEQYFWLHDRYKDTPLADEQAVASSSSGSQSS